MDEDLELTRKVLLKIEQDEAATVLLEEALFKKCSLARRMDI